MIVNTRWLLEYLHPAPSLVELLNALPNAAIEVESVAVLHDSLEPVRVGFIRKKDPLPGTSSMFVCTVECRPNEMRQIVCASEHPLEVGWGVPVALAGTELPTGIAIKEEHFHGVLSQGMICLDGELGMLATGTGLQVFRDEAVLGRRLVDVMEVREALLHLKIPANRPDCLGMIGIAREVAVLLNTTLVPPQAPLPLNRPAASMLVDIAAADLCPRYTCQVATGVRLAKSPPWLHSRLLATGFRPINNVVDITNFVLQEWGHPLHAFDLDRIREQIIVRRLAPGETLELLDGRTVEGATAELVIADAVKPLALAGIMGGRFSSIGSTTKDVVFEAAYFEPTAIRRTSRSLGISTDSSYRFERGLDVNETLDAARERAVSLLLSEAGATAISPVTDLYPAKREPRVFVLSSERVTRYLGVPVDECQMKSSLERLGHRVLSEGSRIEVPTRRVDVNDPVVLIEDVARVIGYDTIQASPTEDLPTRGTTSVLDRARDYARRFLASEGFLEIRGLPLEAASDSHDFTHDNGISVRLTNPLSVDLNQLRRSLVPALLASAAQSARRHSTAFRYFEIDKIFHRSDGGFREDWVIALLLGGTRNDKEWTPGRETDFFDLKGVVESLFERFRLAPVSFEHARMDGYVRGAAARMLTQGLAIGVIGQVSREFLAGTRIEQQLFAAEIYLENLSSNLGTVPIFEQLARFPAVFRDLSFVLPSGVPYSMIEHAIREAGGSLVERVECIDVFEGKGIPSGSRSITVSLVFRAHNRTLLSEEAAACIDRITESLGANFQAVIRS